MWNFFKEEVKEQLSKRYLKEKENTLEVLSDSEKAQEIHENTNLVSIGYQETLTVNNLETLLVFIECYLLIYLVILILKMILVRFSESERLNRVYNKLVEFMCWNIILRFLLEGYLELCIDCMINIRYQSYVHSSVEEIASLFFTYGILLLLVVFPFFILGFFYNLHILGFGYFLLYCFL